MTKIRREAVGRSRDEWEGSMTIQAPAKSVQSSGHDDTEIDVVTEDDRGRWLSIHDACRFLGVDQSTLRRWSDAGKVPVFRTPGGHRRYAEDDLRRLVGEGPRRQERSRLSRQNLTDRSLSAYEEEYLRSARERRWFKAYSPATQEEHRRLGRRLVDIAIRYASSPAESVDRGSYLNEGQQIGEHYGRSGAIAGLSGGETVEAFLFFRYPVVRAVMGMIEEEGLAAKRAARVFIEIGYYMDQVLIATVRGHENYGALVGAAHAMSETQGTMSDV